MNSVSIKYSPEAVHDLDRVYESGLEYLNSNDSATQQVEDIMDSIEGLSLFPEMGTLVSVVTGIDCDYRYIVCGKYLAFYHYDGINVFIDRILHTRMDYIFALGL